MVANNEDPKMTAFAITVDAKLGTSTGISAGDRAMTLRELANPKVSRRTLFVQPRSSFVCVLCCSLRSTCTGYIVL